MAHQQIDGIKLVEMMQAGSQSLSSNVEMVNALNVFPVPDGDTGTNMNLTLTSGVEEMRRNSSSHIGQSAAALAKGLLMGARGNSGVILSQLFRGFSKAMQDEESITGIKLADAFKKGVDTAYKAVMKPVEGTVLTVAREAAEHANSVAKDGGDVIAVMEAVLEEGNASLQRTPKLLPVLAQAGVVDAGGKGLLVIYEGMLAALKGEAVTLSDSSQKTESLSMESLSEVAHEHVQASMDPADIEFGYCTEFMIMLNPERRQTKYFNEDVFRQDLSRLGDSLLVVSDEDLVKVHIHAENPGDALNMASEYGDLTRIKIDNMREQHSEIVRREGQAPQAVATPAAPQSQEEKKYGIVAVVSGSGVADIFRSVGVDKVIEGGQTMNPSTEDIVNAVEELHAEHVIILPNNKNIILAAEQVAHVIDKPITVLPTKTIPQGLAAMLSFRPDVEADKNKEQMTDSLMHVRSGEVTYAVRDSSYNGEEIKEGDFLGINEGKIETVYRDLLSTSTTLLANMMDEDAEIITVIYGEETSAEQVKELSSYIEENYPEMELEVHQGNQPLYFFIFAVE
ncbi:DAK2 domain-containing protein [Mechercharimyces sp. CAU 1602]|uniref:DAK2 domain-containing protein n=1 Tax=Mechercharimyces sp. CAU 1602 TaxID=2973933 RepID=UPI002162FA95|nr:DAK2 domain-containing protein [Mechercharimyces sp. CAU 1602]MCS1351381.1 DAK2 domain-containing protein [Mechercharimyces sp. CAU 1602]